MKKFVYIAIAALFAVCSCHKLTSIDDSVITYYVNLHIQGDQFMQVPIGTAFVDPGCKADVEGKDVTNTIKVSGDEVDPNVAGLYYITYSATNKDGYTSKATRTVAVCDPTIETDISGKYTTKEGTHRHVTTTGAKVAFPGIGPITIRKDAPGIFYVSDIIGGFYSIRAGYGGNYAMKGYIRLFADNHLEILSGHVAGWNDDFIGDGFKEGSYDPATGAINWCVTYGYPNWDFYVCL